ncbi:cytochrome P450 [Kibdelosporangium phytohabitans]|uniref:Cytochrome n=1 Tax=Kibdelosporangium phytohabitans TaxID=860235 RepID=A0A0N9HUR7_9PSEU|nr:cytochrome P450 [Kibdelosporangium phytohabitans]ALG05860.1 cytochrome [Kibdelosporangium phytohabitans]MBE1466106.1 cytochrome P450 [Kibdelosporangium phytohabitans]
MTIAVAPGRWLLLGHTVPMLRRRTGFTQTLHEHGDIVQLRLGPLHTYFLTSPELVHQVLVTDSNSFEKGAIFDRFRPFMGNGLVMSAGAFHMRQRRLVQPAFHRARLQHYADTMRRVANETIGAWQPGEVREFDRDMQRMAVTIVGETLFSTELGRRATAEACKSIPIVLKDGMVRALTPSILERVPVVPANRRFDEAVDRLREIVLDVVAAWRADGEDRGDLLSMLLLAEDADTGERMSDQQVFDEVITLLTAGSETIGVALTWLFHELAKHPEVERKVRAEVDEVLGGRPITFDDVPKLGYTRQVINEVLRMYPIWIFMRRARVDVELAGEHLPAGTEFMLSPHALHHDPRFHDRPGRFDPDRWTGERAATLPKGAFIPFGAGNRQCIGNSFAYTEMTIAVATIIARWRLVPVPGKPVRVTVTSAAYPNRMPMTAVPVT